MHKIFISQIRWLYEPPEGRNYDKKDCILYSPKTNNCIGLDKIYCKNESKCSFYKSNKFYNKDGSKKK